MKHLYIVSVKELSGKTNRSGESRTEKGKKLGKGTMSGAVASTGWFSGELRRINYTSKYLSARAKEYGGFFFSQKSISSCSY